MANSALRGWYWSRRRRPEAHPQPWHSAGPMTRPCWKGRGCAQMLLLTLRWLGLGTRKPGTSARLKRPGSLVSCQHPFQRPLPNPVLNSTVAEETLALVQRAIGALGLIAGLFGRDLESRARNC